MKKISQLVEFPGKALLLEAQKRGEEIGKESGIEIKSAADAELIGLVAILVERGVLKEVRE